VDQMLFPEEALAILRQARWDANATHSYEVMSGGFAWSDERISQSATACMAHGSWAFRFLMGYRASLTRGSSREELRPPWDQLLRECPEWPGFRPERHDASLATELDRESRRVDVCVRRIERRMRQSAADTKE
jgi:hypothetical protein